MKLVSLKDELSSTTYPGRGIIVGRSEDGTKAVAAYFIMGRSANSRNRIFVADGDGLRTQAFDESKVEDPRLIIYAPVRVLKAATIVTNGDQTDTVYDYLTQGKTFEDALRTRMFEPDAPNFTPRISGLLDNPLLDFPNIIAPDVKFYDRDRMVMGKGNVISFGHIFSCHVEMGDFFSFASLNENRYQ